MSFKRRWAAPMLVAVGMLATASCTTDTGSAPKAWISVTSAGNEFVGSEKCQKCHEDEYKTWKASWHAKMVRSPKDALLKDAGENWAKDAKGNAGPVKGNVTGAPFRMEDVQYVIGSHWKQRYLVKNAVTGNLQFMDKQWNTVHRQWEPYGQKNDWESNCATCHATGYKLTSYDPANPATQKASMVEHNTGCASCHGPGARHSVTKKAADVFNPKNASVDQASMVCGYCHVRKENYNFKTAQNHPREDQPHPVLGETFKAGQDDWRKWYPEKMLIPGVGADQPLSRNYPNTDLNNAFFIDEKAQAWKSHDARKHHQEYQEYIQSTHYTKNKAACHDCHSPHFVEGRKQMTAQAQCDSCHKDVRYEIDKIMPGLGSTAANLFLRSHTFNAKQDRKGGPTATGMPEPAYFYKR